MTKESLRIKRREFIKIGIGGLAVVAGVVVAGGVWRIKELFTEESAEEKFWSIISDMESSKVAELSQAARRYHSLDQSPIPKLQITDRFEFDQEPVGLQLVGGLEKGHSGWQIVVWHDALLHQGKSWESWAIYLYYAMLLLKFADSIQGSAQQKIDVLANPELKAKTWHQVWETVGDDFVEKLTDLHLKELWSNYQHTLQDNNRLSP